MRIGEVMRRIHNYFYAIGKEREDVYVIENGHIDLPFLENGQFFRIMGSALNDGVYRNPCYDLTDETFGGVICPLNVPPDFVDLFDEMEKWQAENGSKSTGLYDSESFGGYSYKRATNKNGNAISVYDAFAERLSTYKKVM